MGDFNRHSRNKRNDSVVGTRLLQGDNARNDNGTLLIETCELSLKILKDHFQQKDP